MIVLAQNWQMWCVFAIVAIAVYFYVRESFSIEAISISVIVALMLFFHIFVIDKTTPNLNQDFTTDNLLSGFAAPALITIMALLVIGQGMFQTGALEGPIAHMDIALDRAPRQTLFFVFIMVFAISMFMNNTPVVVMFIPIFIAMSAKLGHETSRYLMPLSFLSILAGMTTLIGSSTNLLVNDILQRSTNMSLGFFSQFWPGMALAAIGAVYIIIFAPILLPRREKSVTPAGPQGQQYIAQIHVTDNHPLRGLSPIAGLFPKLHTVTLRMILRADESILPPFEDSLQSGDILIVAATRKSLAKLLTSDRRYLKGMLDIAGFDAQANEQSGSIVISEVVIAPASRMIGRNIKQIGFRRQTNCLVLGIQRRSRMIRKSMLNIRLEAGDVLLLFGYETDMNALRYERDLILLDWSKAEIPDIRKSKFARYIFGGTILLAATSLLPIEIAALCGAILMIATSCLNIRQAVRALDMRIFLLIGAAFAMGLALEQTGGAVFIGNGLINLAGPFGDQALIAALFLVIAIFTNIISNSAAALLFAPIALAISQQSQIDPKTMLLTVIFAANCCFATPIAYQTNLLVLGPGHYKFSDFARFGIPLIFILWVSYILLLPLFFGL